MKPWATSAITETTRTPLRTWRPLWRGQGPPETTVKSWCGAAAIRQLWFLFLPPNTSKRSPECSLFLPGEYLDAPDAVHDAAAKVSVPIFVTSAKDRNEIAAASPSSPLRPRDKRLSLSAHCRCARIFDVARGQKSRRRIGKLAGCGISRQFWAEGLKTRRISIGKFCEMRIRMLPAAALSGAALGWQAACVGKFAIP